MKRVIGGLSSVEQTFDDVFAGLVLAFILIAVAFLFVLNSLENTERRLDALIRDMCAHEAGPSNFVEFEREVKACEERFREEE